MGSSFITSLKLKDNWVFVGRAGTKIKSVFEKVSEFFLFVAAFVLFVSEKTMGYKANKTNQRNVFFFTCQQAVNDEKTNAFEKWPNMVEVAGCFPRSLNATL